MHKNYSSPGGSKTNISDGFLCKTKIKMYNISFKLHNVLVTLFHAIMINGNCTQSGKKKKKNWKVVYLGVQQLIIGTLSSKWHHCTIKVL